MSREVRAKFALAAAAGLLLLPSAAALAGAESTDERPTARTALPDRASREAAIAELVQDLDRWIGSCPLGEARISIHVDSVVTGEELYSRGADRLLNPASNIKLVTAAAALAILGPEYRFKTEIWVDEPPDASGTINGNIYVKGFGDPGFVTERMVRLVLDLWNAGVRRVTGDLVIDDTFFSERREGPGWEQETSDRPYIAPVGAVSLNRNAVAIHVRPGSQEGARAEIILDPESPYFILDNRVTTGSRRSRMGQRSSSIAEGNRQRILVRGVHPIHADQRTHWKKIDNPPHYFAQTFRTFMHRQGVRFNRQRVRTAAVPDRARLFHTAHSPPLAEILGPLNKFSNNHVAEMLVLAMGAETRGAPGSWEKGSEAVADFLAGIGIERGSYVFRNGSGLNDVNRISARQMTTLLGYSWLGFQMSPEFVVSLPVSGRDGTTRWRMEDAGGFVRAKTGTLENVSALSGYVGTPAGEVLAFSVIVNDHSGPLRDVILGIDGVPNRLVAFGGVATPQRSRPAPLLTIDAVTDIEERAAVYLALHAAANERSVGYLLRSMDQEPDELLRAVAADAVFRCSAEVGAPLLVRYYQPTPESLGRLLRLAGGLGEPIPILSSLADLAAEGDQPAMRLLLKTAHAAVGNDSLTEWFTETLTEVGRAAPEDLLAALIDMQASPGGVRALELLAHGLRIDAEEPSVPGRHPFREALTAASGRRTPAGAPESSEISPASALGERLDRLIEGVDGEAKGQDGGPTEFEGQNEGGARDPALPASPTAAVDSGGGEGESE